MARAVAARWVAAAATAEYRFSIYGCGTRAETRHLAALLKSFRDGKTRLAGVEAIGDLGVADRGDHVEVWSADVARLSVVAAWAEGRGMDTSFIW